MTMIDYHVQFRRMVRYAPHVVVIRELQVQCFVEGLKPYIFKVMVGCEMTYK